MSKEGFEHPWKKDGLMRQIFSPTLITPADLAQLAQRLPPDKAQLLVEGARSLHGVYDLEHGMGWVGHVNWFEVAKTTGMHCRRVEQTAEKFDRLGLQYLRNNYDGWLTLLGLEVARILDPSL